MKVDTGYTRLDMRAEESNVVYEDWYGRFRTFFSKAFFSQKELFFVLCRDAVFVRPVLSTHPPSEIEAAPKLHRDDQPELLH